MSIVWVKVWVDAWSPGRWARRLDLRVALYASSVSEEAPHEPTAHRSNPDLDTAPRGYRRQPFHPLARLGSTAERSRLDRQLQYPGRIREDLHAHEGRRQRRPVPG